MKKTPTVSLTAAGVRRRSFLASALAAGAAPLILSSRAWSQGDKPAEKVRMGFIGVGIQGRGLLGGFLGQNNDVHVLAVCDVDTTRRNAAKQKVEEHYKGKGLTEECAAYNDFRELLARKDIDAVCIATPDHWHGIVSTAAMKAGKDVYCEKPLVHSVEEAVAIMASAKKYNRVLQCGSMQRSSKEFRIACELVRNGVIGKIERVHCSFGQPGKPCDLPEEAMEPGLDWERWLGPAPVRPYNSILAPRGVHNHFPLWRLYSEFGGGYVTDWGAHHLDIAQWGLGMDESGPTEIVPPANAAKAKDGAELHYANGVTVLHKQGDIGVQFFGSDGIVKVDRGKFSLALKGEVKAQFLSKEDGTSLDGAVSKAEKEFLVDAKVKLYQSPKGNHLVDFIACVRSRQKPCTHVEIGARSATVCNLLNLGYYHGQKLSWDPAKFVFTNGTGNAEWLKAETRGEYKLEA